MVMKSVIILSSFAVAALASRVPERRLCAEAARFGVMEVVPTDLVPGDGFTIHMDFSCGISLGYVPIYTDYYYEVLTDNNGHEPPLLIYRRPFNVSNGPTDTFTADVPEDAFFFNGSYSILLQNTYSDSGAITLALGETSVPINLTVPATD